jgi:hypothetical protein
VADSSDLVYDQLGRPTVTLGSANHLIGVNNVNR